MQVNSVIAQGQLLTTYHQDLLWFLDFRKEISKGSLNIQHPYSPAEGHWIWKYFSFYRVSRNLPVELRHNFAIVLNKWDFRTNNKVDDVDKLSDAIRDATGKHLLSLSSKLMMLANPSLIIPYDSNGKRVLEFSGTLYRNYYERTLIYFKDHEDEIKQELASIKDLIAALEEAIPGKVENLQKVRLLRYMDKKLWVEGIKN